MGCKPGKVAQQDHEYKRNGTRNLFMLVTPKRGERNVIVTQRRTRVDFAYFCAIWSMSCIPRLNTLIWSWII